MEALALKEEAKNIIDTLDYSQTLRVIDFARTMERKEDKIDVRNLRNFRGKIDLDIDLDALRGRNDPRPLQALFGDGRASSAVAV